MKARPPPCRIVLLPSFSFAVLVATLDRGTTVKHFCQPSQRSIDRQVAPVILGFLFLVFRFRFFLGQGMFADQPSFWSCPFGSRPMCPYGHELLRQQTFRAFAPSDGLPGRSRLPSDNGIRTVQRSISRSDLICKAHSEIASHRHATPQSALLQACQEVRIVPISAVGHDSLKGHSHLPCLVNHIQRDLRFGLKDHILRNAGLFPSRRVVGPLLEQIEPTARRPCIVWIHIVTRDKDLTVGDFAQLATILPTHADTFVSLAGIAAFIHHQYSVSCHPTRQHRLHALLVEGLLVPLCFYHQPVDCAFRQACYPFGNPSAALALNIAHLAGHEPF